jgi:metal-dependent amidase/aminoacylase/carboxypeptidase family protein
VQEAQTVVSREIKPIHPAVVTIGQFVGGTTYNIIPERVHLKGTVRTLHHESRDIAEAALRRLAEGIGVSMRVKTEMIYVRKVPPLVNDDRVLDPVLAAVRRQMGDVISEGEPSMGAEDFAEFAAVAPSFQLRIGSGQPGRDDRLHNAFYQPDERSIGLGVQALSRAALDLLA